MRIAVIGGGPAGLYFAISMKLRDPAHDIHLFERNRQGETFGWGVVFSDQTLENLEANDPASAAVIAGEFPGSLYTETDDPDEDFNNLDSTTGEQAVAVWRGEIAESRRITAELPLEAIGTVPVDTVADQQKTYCPWPLVLEIRKGGDKIIYSLPAPEPPDVQKRYPGDAQLTANIGAGGAMQLSLAGK